MIQNTYVLDTSRQIAKSGGLSKPLQPPDNTIPT